MRPGLLAADPAERRRTGFFEQLRVRVRTTGDDVVVATIGAVGRDAEVSGAALDARTNGVVRALLSHGLQRGDAAALGAHCGPDAIAALIGCHALGIRVHSARRSPSIRRTAGVLLLTEHFASSAARGSAVIRIDELPDLAFDFSSTRDRWPRPDSARWSGEPDDEAMRSAVIDRKRRWALHPGGVMVVCFDAATATALVPALFATLWARSRLVLIEEQFARRHPECWSDSLRRSAATHALAPTGLVAHDPQITEIRDAF